MVIVVSTLGLIIGLLFIIMFIFLSRKQDWLFLGVLISGLSIGIGFYALGGYAPVEIKLEKVNDYEIAHTSRYTLIATYNRKLVVEKNLSSTNFKVCIMKEFNSYGYLITKNLAVQESKFIHFKEHGNYKVRKMREML